MFAVKYNSNNALEKQWYCNDIKPIITSSDITKLIASGDELELIRKSFDNLPITLGGICTWKGAFAQFIYDNL